MISLIVSSLPEEGSDYQSTLIVCPVSLMNHWESEIRTKLKGEPLKVYVHHGSNRATYKYARKFDVVITSYHTLSSSFNAETQKGSDLHR